MILSAGQSVMFYRNGALKGVVFLERSLVGELEDVPQNASNEVLRIFLEEKAKMCGLFISQNLNTPYTFYITTTKSHLASLVAFRLGEILFIS